MKLTWGDYFMVKFEIPGMHAWEKTGSTVERSFYIDHQ